jgi:hypothetical protein
MRNFGPTSPKRAVGKSGPSSRDTLVLQAPEAPKQGRTLGCIRPVCEEVWVKLGVARMPVKRYERRRAAGASVSCSILNVSFGVGRCQACDYGIGITFVIFNKQQKRGNYKGS